VINATSARLSRMLEDEDSQIPESIVAQLGDETAAGVRERKVYRHVAVANGLKAGERIPYQVECVDDNGKRFRSETFTLQPLPGKGQAVSILLTSDQQNQPMSAANYQKVKETAGQLDAILFAGDFVDHPNRASEWFDRTNAKRPAFYPALQGRLNQLGATTFTGGALLQQAVLLGSLGNHDVSGRWRPESSTIKEMYNDPQPRWYAEFGHRRAMGGRDRSFESVTYDERWEHPDTAPQGERYWSYQYGDVFVISLHVNRIWRMWGDTGKASSERHLRVLQIPNNGDLEITSLIPSVPTLRSFVGWKAPSKAQRFARPSTRSSWPIRPCLVWVRTRIPFLRRLRLCSRLKARNSH
jgi:hypothetical protein